MGSRARKSAPDPRTALDAGPAPPQKQAEEREMSRMNRRAFLATTAATAAGLATPALAQGAPLRIG
jgi:hypothetical protein